MLYMQIARQNGQTFQITRKYIFEINSEGFRGEDPAIQSTVFADLKVQIHQPIC